MKTIYTIFCYSLLIFLPAISLAQLNNVEVAKGLKEALTQGISKGTDALSKADGYFKNPLLKLQFPPDAQNMEKKLRDIGMGSQVDDFILTLNRSAEDAAKQAKPIFIDAIKKMSFTDAVTILKGQPDAATQYLKTTVSAQLQTQFKPIIQASLNKTNATKYYTDLAKKYNQIPFVKTVNSDLSAYTTDLAIQGLFTMIAQEEKNIRANPQQQASNLLKKIFSAK